MCCGIKEGIEQRGQFGKAIASAMHNLIADARREYDEIARTDVQKAFFVSFEKEAPTLLDNYLDNVEAYRSVETHRSDHGRRSPAQRKTHALY